MTTRCVALRRKLGETEERWLTLGEAERTRLGGAGASLGAGAVLGAQVWDRQSKIRIWLGPLSLPQYEAFLPGGVLLRKLVDWMRLYLGFELEWDVRLLLTAAAVPHLRLGAGTRLGWTTWLGHCGNAADAGDLCLNAEAFVTRSMPATEAGVRGASGV